MTYREGENCNYNNVSKSFKKILERFTSRFLIEEIGEIFDPKEFNVSFWSKPIYNPETKETFVDQFTVSSPKYDSYVYQLYFWHINKNKEIKLLDEIIESEICFRVEFAYGTPDFMKATILKYGKFKNEVILGNYSGCQI
jgi:hypothetical protein